MIGGQLTVVRKPLVGMPIPAADNYLTVVVVDKPSVVELTLVHDGPSSVLFEPMIGYT